MTCVAPSQDAVFYRLPSNIPKQLSTSERAIEKDKSPRDRLNIHTLTSIANISLMEKTYAGRLTRFVRTGNMCPTDVRLVAHTQSQGTKRSKP